MTNDYSEMMQRISNVQAQYAQDLMQKPHVVGVAVGMAQENGAYTDEMALVVLVDQKVPLDQLNEAERIPATIDGVRVDVQQTGGFQAQGTWV